MQNLRTYRLKLYPNAAQAASMPRFAGSCRWLWNHLLAMQKAGYAETGKFVFFHDMSKLLPGLKREFPWLADSPSNSLVRVCRNLDLALRHSFKSGEGFPKFKQRGVARESFYVINQAMRIDGNKVVLPKLGPVRFRAGRAPDGRIVGANVSFDGRDWWCTVQCEISEPIETVPANAATVVGVDLGLTEAMICSDGVRVAAPKHLRKAQKRLRRAQRCLSRRQKRSANRRRQARRVAAIHRNIRNQRRDFQHKATAAVVGRASVVVTEDLNVKGMIRNRRLALGISDAAWGETLRQIGYKTAWAGKTHLKVGRFEPSTQTCSSCGVRKTGADRLTLSQRMFRCDCGHVLDRDMNAARNLRNIGLEQLGLSGHIPINVGQVMPERDGSCSSDACGDPSAGPAVPAAGRCGSPKQEVARAISYAT